MCFFSCEASTPRTSRTENRTIQSARVRESRRMAGRLVMFVCFPLAALLLFFNLRSYPSLVASRAAAPQVQWHPEREAAGRSMNMLKGDANAQADGGPDATYEVVHDDDDDAAADDDADDAEEGDGEEEDGEPAAKAAEPAQIGAAAGGGSAVVLKPRPALAGGHDGDGGAAAYATTRAAEAPSSSTFDRVGSVVSSVVTSAIGTANAAAAVVTSVSDSLKAAAGNGACKPKSADWKQRPLNFLVPVQASACACACACACAGECMCMCMRVHVHVHVRPVGRGRRVSTFSCLCRRPAGWDVGRRGGGEVERWVVGRWQVAGSMHPRRACV